MFRTLKNAWGVPELRKKIYVTIFIIIIYRIGAVLPVPYFDSAQLAALRDATSGSIFDYLNILSGDAFSRGTLFALSISPYITASIVIQLLTVAIPALERMQKSGEEGRKKLTQITRIVTVALGLITAIGYYFYMRNNGALTSDSLFSAIVIIACYSAGTALIMWLAEKINDKGIGNGISIILFANIVSSFPQIIRTFIGLINSYKAWGVVAVEAILITVLVVVTFIVWFTNSERRLPVQYAKKVVGRKMYGGQNTTLPLKLNMDGVMPIIFANSIVSIPATLALIIAPTGAQSTTTGMYENTNWWGHVVNALSYRSPIYIVIFFVLIIAFAYFYTAISFNPVEVANNLKKQGGSIPGIRPGKPTADYISKILGRITLIGALFLSVVAVLPLVVNMVSKTSIGSLAFSGSSILIVVGVALETARELEAQVTMRHYKGFLD